MKTIEPIMKRLLLIANEFDRTKTLDESQKQNFYSAMGELMHKTGFNYQQAENMLICWIEDPEKVQVLQDVV